jgi:hypothetical protein
MLAFTYRPGNGLDAMNSIEAFTSFSRAFSILHRCCANARDYSGRICAILALASPFAVAGAQGREPAALANPAWSLDLEIQHLDILVNTVRKGEGYTGTRIDTTQYTGRQSNGGRLTAFRSTDWLYEGDALRFVIAPFRRFGTAPPRFPVVFDGAQFQAGSPTAVVYKFNTYRVSYLVPILGALRADGWDFRLGGTLAIRDARVAVSQGNKGRNFYNWGPVPLLYFSGSKDLGDHWRLAGDVDVFPAPGGGGLFDGALKVAYGVSKNVEVNAGGRYEFGGVTGSAFYNFIRDRAVVAGVNVRF